MRDLFEKVITDAFIIKQQDRLTIGKSLYNSAVDNLGNVIAFNRIIYTKKTLFIMKTIFLIL